MYKYFHNDQKKNRLVRIPVLTGNWQNKDTNWAQCLVKKPGN